MIGPNVGSCGTAAYLRETTVVEDIHQLSRFAAILHPLCGLGLKACWSFPVLGATGEVVAVLGLYSPDPRQPNQRERELAATCVELCATAMRRHRRVVERERRASIDALTKLPNRLAFNAAMENMRCDEIGSWGLFVLDLDNLKIVNDTFGHLVE